MNDVIAGVVPMYAAAPATALPHVKGGSVVALGQTGAKRSEFIKDIPTFAEQGVPDYDVELWYALLGPAKLPTDISGRLRKEITEILAKPEVRSRLLSLGFEPKPSSGDQLADTLRAEMKQWSEVAKAAKLSAE
jgi:tripartite-type tricarboxylate transporter receptor subunit TctC